MPPKTYLDLWERSSITIRPIEFTAPGVHRDIDKDQNVRALASLLVDHAPGHAVDALLFHIIATVQFDHDGDKDPNDDLSRILSTLTQLAHEDRI